MNSLKIAICQMKVSKHKDENLSRAKKMIETAVKRGSQMVVLPEMFNCPYENKYFSLFAEKEGGKTTKLLCELAKEWNVYIIGGSIPEKDEERVYNTCYVFDPTGKRIGKHRKLHLFDVDIEGEITFKESDYLECGEKITVVDTMYGKIGIGICYDIRFVEQMRLMALKGAKMIIIPAVFNTLTGKDHWQLLLRARAIDQQVYCIGASQARNREAFYQAYGYSSIVDPWGKIVACAREDESIIYGQIDFKQIEKIRRQLPLLRHRRKDLYSIEEYKGR